MTLLNNQSRRGILTLMIVLVFILGMSATAAEAQTVTVQYRTTTDYGSGFQGEIKITNTGTQAINGWTLAFTFDRTLSSIWDANIVSRVGNRYTVKDVSYNAVIAAGGSVTFGFTGSPGGVTAASAPSSYTLNGTPVTGSQSPTPTTFTYQGRFTDTSAASQPTSGTYTMTFRLYDAESGGNQVATTPTEITSMVSVTNGIFTVRLDFGAAAFNTAQPRYLGIQVGSTVLTPRQEITSTPFAQRALNSAAADALSSACAGCVTNAQIGAVDGAKVTGTVANANTAGSATTATLATTATTAGNVTGVVAIANGGTGSATQNFVDLSTNQTVAGAKTFSGNLRTNGLLRSGSETGTGQPPIFNPTSGNYNGLVTRRVNSTTTAVQVLARTNILRLERDGTTAGLRIANDATSDSSENLQSVHCLGISNTGAVVAVRSQINVSTAATTTLYTNAQNIEYVQCSFGNTYNYGHQTQVTLQRYLSDFYWVGTLTSTFNQ